MNDQIKESLDSWRMVHICMIWRVPGFCRVWCYRVHVADQSEKNRLNKLKMYRWDGMGWDGSDYNNEFCHLI